MKNFEHFPLDTQSCNLVLESCGYSISEVRLRWMPWNPVSIASEKFQLPDFRFVNLTYDQSHKDYASGTWDQLRITLTFKRLYGYYILQVTPTLSDKGQSYFRLSSRHTSSF